MSEPFIGEIRMFPYTFSPRGWASCNGQALPISQYQALFAIIGTTYGGDGKSNFKVPKLNNLAVMGIGSGPGLTPRALSQQAGEPTVTLTLSQLPAHNHTLVTTNMTGTSLNPNGLFLGHYFKNATYVENPSVATYVPMSDKSLGSVGGGQAHENRQPSLAMPFFIALDGIFPMRN